MRWRTASALVVLAVALALVLSWSLGAFGADAVCTKMGPGAVQYMQSGMAHHVRLGTLYGVRRDKTTWILAAHIPGAGVAVWQAPTPNGTSFLTPIPMNAVAVDNWLSVFRSPKNVEKAMYPYYRAEKAYQQAVACLR
jgi:hypothetical protein